MPYSLITACVCFVSHIFFVVLNPINLYQVKKDLWDGRVSQIKSRGLCFIIVVENIGTAYNCLSTVFIMPEGKSTR